MIGPGSDKKFNMLGMLEVLDMLEELDMLAADLKPSPLSKLAAEPEL